MMDRLLIDIASGMYITPAAIPQDVIGAEQDVVLTVHGYVGALTIPTNDPRIPPSASYGNIILPRGRTLTDNGDGTLTISGARAFLHDSGSRWLTVYDAAGQSAQISYPWGATWSDPPATYVPDAVPGGIVAPVLLLGCTVGVPVDAEITVGGSGAQWGSPPDLNAIDGHWAHPDDSAGLPPGLTMQSKPPKITGTPTAAGQYKVAIWTSRNPGSGFPTVYARAIEITVSVSP